MTAKDWTRSELENPSAADEDAATEYVYRQAELLRLSRKPTVERPRPVEIPIYTMSMVRRSMVIE